MITREKIDRINELAKKSRLEGLSDEEKQEQSALRAEYLASIRKNFRMIMDNTLIEEPNGERHPVKRRVH